MRFFYIILLFCASVYANTPYAKGLSLYENKNFAEAFLVFDKYKSQYYENVAYNFYYGASAYEIGKYESAMIAFDRVLFTRPEHQLTKFYLALSKYQLKFYEESQNDFKALLSDKTLSPNLVSQSKLYLKQIRKKLSPKNTNITLGAGIFYDNNVYQSSTQSTFVPFLNQSIKSDKKINDYYHQQLLSISHKSQIQDNFSITNNLAFLNNGYFDEKSQNIQYFGYFPSLNFYNDLHAFDINLGISEVLKNKHKYLKSYFVNPTFTIKKPLEIKFSGLALSKRYEKIKDNGYDSNTFEGKISLSHALKNIAFVTYNIALGKEKQMNDKRVDVSNKYSDFSLDLFIPIKQKMYLQLNNSYEKKNYESYNILFKNTRKDTVFSSNAYLAYQFSDLLMARFLLSYNNSHSNQGIYKYQKMIFGFEIFKSFEF